MTEDAFSDFYRESFEGKGAVSILTGLPKPHRTIASGLTLLASVLTAAVLFRYSREVWPAYIFSSLVLINVLLIVLSEGRSLVLCAFTTACAAGTWIAWVVFRDDASRWALEEIDRPYLIAAGAASGVLAYSLFGAWVTAPKLTRSAAYYLITVAAILILWGVWGVMVERHDVRDWLVYATVATILITSVTLFVAVDLDSPFLPDPGALFGALDFGVVDPVVRPHLGYRLVAHWWLFAAYLGGVLTLWDAFDGTVTSFLPRLLGSESLDYEFPSTPEPLKWKGLVTAAAFGIGVLGLLGISLVAAIRDFEEDETQKQRRREIVAARSSETNPVNVLFIDLQLIMFDIQRGAGIAAALISRMVVHFVRGLILTLQRLARYSIHVFRLLIAPIVGFSIISLTMVLVLTEFASPGSGEPALDLWAQAFTLGLGVLLLAYLSFYLMDDSRQLEPLGNLLAISLFSWFGASVVAGLASGLLWLSVHFTSVESRIIDAALPGDVLLINLGLIAVVAVPAVFADRLPGRFPARMQAIFFVPPVLVALVFGLPDIIRGFADAT